MKLACPINPNPIIAFSGGVDSVFLFQFCLRGKKNPEFAYFNHETKNGEKSCLWIKDYAKKYGVKLTVGELTASPKRGSSLEAFWREQRQHFFAQLGRNVYTAHNLNDAAETYLFTAIRGNPQLIPVEHGFNKKPLLFTTKAEIVKTCLRKDWKWIEDETNQELAHDRNKIRHNVLPEVLKINKGFLTTVRNLYAPQ